MWNSPLPVWKENLSRYAGSVRARQTYQKKDGLVELDQFIWQDLPDKLSSREPPHVNSEEYSQILRWKLKRGKWRPRLQKFADETPDDEIIKASKASFSALKAGDIRSALNHLVSLKGCGPATASALLAAHDDTIPFMSDELLLEAQGGTKKYTVSAYLQLVDYIRDKASKLSKEDAEHVWTSRDVEKAVFASRTLGDRASEQQAWDVISEARVQPSQTGKRQRTETDEPYGESLPSVRKDDSRKMGTEETQNVDSTHVKKKRNVSPKTMSEEARVLRRSSRKRKPVDLR